MCVPDSAHSPAILERRILTLSVAIKKMAHRSMREVCCATRFQLGLGGVGVIRDHRRRWLLRINAAASKVLPALHRRYQLAARVGRVPECNGYSRIAAQHLFVRPDVGFRDKVENSPPESTKLASIRQMPDDRIGS